jgi:hypothetical protein
MNHHDSIILAQPYENDPQSTFPCTFIWDTIYNLIEHEDPAELDGLPLPIDLAIANVVPNHEFRSVKWIINRISTPIGTGDRFWFHFNQPFQKSRTSPLLLGELSIHHFIRNYALIEISPI